MDEHGQETGGGPGLLLIAGPSRMQGYWRAPRSPTRRALRGRWLVTGDVGTVSGDGFLTLLGRASEVINRGGEKISPIQVEAALSQLPEVAESAVVGAPHPLFGERVVAFVAAKPQLEFDADLAREALLERIADYAVPERFYLLDELPRTAARTVDRLSLKRHAQVDFATEPA